MSGFTLIEWIQLIKKSKSRLNLMNKPVKFKFYSTFSFLIVLFLFTSCSDSSTGLDDNNIEPPEIPELIPVDINTDYFSDNTPAFNELTASFYEASGYAQIASFTLMGASLLGTGFLELARSDDAEFKNGMWEWAYSFQQGSESLSIRVTAKPVSSGYEWNVFLSGNFSGLGQSLDEFLFLSGTVNSDGTGGGWNFFDPESQSPVLFYKWDITSATVYSVEYTFNDTEEGDDFTISYDRDGHENFIFFTGNQFDAGVELYWNTNTLNGYIVQDGEKRCWNSNFEETACS
ncbi:MAG: hypothetical protein EA390_11830 [Balneolaceae bacterium]|nr:MAG: hypothetical protein EA390_11830 [Balneolaceae bacterium]